MPKKIPVAIFFVLWASCFTLAQQQLQHEKKVYHDKNGRIYINQEMPVYFFFSTSKGAQSKKHQLKSEVNPKLTDPVNFSSEGDKSITVTYTQKGNGGRVPVNIDFHVDGTPPESSVTFSSEKQYRAENMEFYSNDLNVTITADDDQQSMVADIYYSLNGNPYKKYQQPLSLSKEGAYDLKFYAVDNVGNVEVVSNRKFTVDGTPPVSQHKINGPSVNQTLAPKAEIVLSAKDKLTGIGTIKYSIDGGQEVVYNEPISLSDLNDGKHELVFYATDNLGLEEDKTKHKMTFYLDLYPPEIDLTIDGPKYLSDGFLFIPESSKLKVSASDNHSGVDKIFYQVTHEGPDTKEKTPLTEYKNGISFSKNGKKTIMVKAFDKIGNEMRRNKVLYLDKEKPKTGIKYGKPQIFNNDTLYITLSTKVTLFTTKYDSGVKHTKFSINGGQEKIYNGNNLTFNSEGIYRVQYYSEDNVGNTENKKTAQFAIDNTPPRVELVVLGTTPKYETIDDGEKALFFSLDGILRLDANDRCGVKNIYYWLNDGPKMDYSQTRQITLTEARDYNLKVKAVDNLGNSMTKEFMFYVTSN